MARFRKPHAGGFVADFRDQAASSRAEPQLIDTLTPGLMALAVIVSAAESVLSFLPARLSAPPVLFKWIGLLVCASYAAAVIQAKLEPGTATAGLVGRPQYRYAPLARTLAKVGFVLSLVMMVHSGWRAVWHLRPLPPTIYGYLHDQADRPRAGLRLAVVSQRGDVLANSAYETDDRGFYIIRAPERIPRSARLQIIDGSGACGARGLLALSRELQVPPSTGAATTGMKGTVFRHRVQCSAGL